MTVDHADPCASAYWPTYYHNCDSATEFRDTFFIGVYGRTSSRFYILASLVGMQARALIDTVTHFDEHFVRILLTDLTRTSP